MIKIGINGACGKMGLRLAGLASQQPGVKLTIALEKPGHRLLGKDIGNTAGFDSRERLLITDAVNGKIADVILDFSTPSATMNCLDVCKKYRIALLIGTTGFNPAQLKKIKDAGKLIPVLLNPNFSQGAGLLGQLGSEAIKSFGKNVNAEIIETHHSAKRDAPSGTALKLAQALLKDLKRKSMPIHSVRVGQVVGEHKIIFAIPGERIELTHKVDSRDAFVYGALKAAVILARKKAGFYALSNILRSE
ncbi:MAG: 4-hydroxy-tetrahydrodipicolinate reductase [Planctomycetes bacterium]|nr:4-hydroxy-tetrahydrodipicolinate reductase [Planctomycetota bacterium]